MYAAFSLHTHSKISKMSSASDSSDDELPPFKTVSSDVFRRLSELAPAASHNQKLTEAEMQATRCMEQEIKAAASVTRQNLLRVDAQLNALQRMRRDLLGEATTQDSVLQLCSKLRAPIRRVSQEIIREIGLYSLPLFPMPVHQHSSLSFSHVCSTWRKIALSTPRMWNTLFLTVKSPLSLPMYGQLVREWLQRANPMPATLVVYFRLSLYDIMQCEVELHRFFEQLSHCLTHVRHLGFGSHKIEDLQMIFSRPLNWTLPALRQLDIHTSYGNLSETNAIPRSVDYQLFKSAPALKNLILDSLICLPWEPPHLISWGHLTGIYLVRPTNLKTWVTIMNLCQVLHTCIVSLEEDYVPVPPVSPLPVHNLKKLSVNLTTQHPRLSIAKVISHFRLPELTKMDLTCPPGPVEYKCDTEIPNISDLPSLQYLSLLMTSDAQDQVYDLLAKATSLSEASLTSFDDLPSNFMEHLIHNRGRGGQMESRYILPNLSTLRIDLLSNFQGRGHEPIDLLKRLVLSRLDVTLPTECQRLERVLINVPNDGAETFFRAGLLEWSKTVGVEVEIHRLGPNYSQKLYIPRVALFTEAMWDGE